eukprot:CAMPEP_0198358994 /NCGR_PEP_ID=MMETSP1450-20131203/132928_1 /TAXON_ID=753684 ORGANISM="Madagascaria erythrocladiodes, Strain CCMP3234" /NCGR_SAMPLE_ID=MMETSP1450 /ASSEMBLY_ACC=CAM_ASM_001115 /LENGTH=129 /DNA_ID=CAMNT_0044065815 /DNA_START=168 /DNA_END=554 /DNA_ORIENTATION=-
MTLLNNRHLENPIAFSKGTTRLLSTLYLHAYYVRLLVYPYVLTFDYSYDCIPLVRSLSDPRNALTIASYVGLALTLYVALRHRRSSPYGATLLVALAFFLCPFVPLANLFVSVGTMVAERLLYMPSLGF